MNATTTIAYAIGSVVGFIARFLRRGAGITWSGEIALRIDPSFVSHMAPSITHRILIAGTNGKTTTSAMIAHIFSDIGYSVVHNTTGANLLNGIAGTIIANRNKLRGTVIGVFESDEAAFTSIVREVKPDVVVLLNLFRDQLDRYGEVDSVATGWRSALKSLQESTVLVANGDDPLVISVAESWNGTVQYFGLSDETSLSPAPEHAADSTFCIHCGARLYYHKVYLSHLGDWYCPSCKRKRPDLALSEVESPLPGVYNIYNTLAAVLTVKQYKIPKTKAEKSLGLFKPVFGRQEEIDADGKKIKLFLSKNPAGFNESLRTVKAENATGCILLALNDQIPDGTDVSWIWDVDFEEYLPKDVPIVITGDRAYDMGLRVKYQAPSTNNQPSSYVTIEPELEEAIQQALEKTPAGKTMYVFPTYSAMLDMRKILTGRKIN
jgi:lipid II isoglutaminyl synthase (glutamine-hydrolysing)